MSLRLVSLLSALLMASPAGALAGEWQFIFNPPVGRPLVESLKRTHIEIGRRTSVEVFEVQMQVVTRRTAAGYALARTPLLLRHARDGKQLAQAMGSSLRGVVLTDETDANGQLLALHGYERLGGAGRHFVAQAVARWNSRIGDFAGHSVRVGDVAISRHAYRLPTGREAWFYAATKYVGAVPCGQRQCLQMQFAWSSDPSELGLSISALPMGYQAVALTEHVQAGLEVTGSGHRLIDPGTMLIYSESVQQRVRTWMQRPGGKKVWKTVIEELEYSWQ